ncbi:YjcQ protein [Peptostreptococcaceae bacterium oral taxon 113 str. W5053]|nr:YjcQ protein [Peptostreptococcaceae bacterium oral taxon 113 str. W5053]
MAKDDYQVIVYQILSYLYNCLKKGIDIEPDYLIANGKLFNINSNYWRFIIYNLHKDGLIDGISLVYTWGDKYPHINDLTNIGITPKGIQFLTDNSFIQKSKELLKDVKGIIPFV